MNIFNLPKLSYPISKKKIKYLYKFYDMLAKSELNYELSPMAINDESIPIALFGQQGLPSYTVLSKKTALMYNKYQLDKESTSVFYQSLYRNIYNADNYHKSKGFYDSLASNNTVFNFLDKINVIDEDMKVIVELGCDSGQNLVPFDNGKRKLIGFDFDEVNIEAGKKKWGLDGLQSGDLNTLVQKNDINPDLVILNHVIEHVKDLNETFEILDKIIDNGKLLFIGIPELFVWSEKSNYNIVGTIQLAHNYYFTYDFFINYSYGYGFTLIHKDQKGNLLFRKVKFSDHKAPSHPPDHKTVLGKYNDHVLRFKNEKKTIYKIKSYIKWVLGVFLYIGLYAKIFFTLKRLKFKF
jgi:2-polyprenyl-3-methyl-5-hydroxy-6-metoxy-1,4-benzoquinol methylase